MGNYLALDPRMHLESQIKILTLVLPQLNRLQAMQATSSHCVVF